MAATFFSFKQFTIHQDICGMKVTTDACLFGAWVATMATTFKPEKVLDIGTGTGLLSLLFAQQNNTSCIDAIDIDSDAVQQATSNVALSIFKQKIKIHHSAIQKFNGGLYDFIISNPPFFTNSLQGKNEQKNVALHTNTLSLTDLFYCVKNSLDVDGKFALLLPYNLLETAINIGSQHQLFPLHIGLVKQTPAHDFFRVMIIFSYDKQEPTNEIILIKNEDGNYSQSFSRLLKEYYLYL